MSVARRWFTLGLLLFLWCGPGFAAETDVLRIGVPWPLGSKSRTDLQSAARSLSKQTEGRVRVKFVEQHDLDSDGMRCDGALLSGPALARISPASRIFSLPLLIHSSAEGDHLRERMGDRIDAELESRGLASLAHLDLGFAYIHSKEAVETVDQLKSVRLWVPPAEPESIRIAESYGLSPVPLDAARVRDALRQGTVDAAIVPPLGAIVLQWHTEITHVTDDPFMVLFAVVVIRNEALAVLEESDQVLLRSELARAFTAVAQDLRRKEPEALDVLVQNGVNRRPFGTTPEQRAEWTAWSASVADRLAAGELIPPAGLEETRRILSEFRAKSR